MAVLSRSLILVLLLSIMALCSSSTVAFVGDEEDRDFDGTPSLTHEKSDDSLCGIGSVCTPIGSCALLQDLMEQSCLISEKLGALTCGYRGNEVLVCCPQGSSNNPFTYHHISSQASSSSQKKIACGQPLFNNIKQGGNGGLGSHPWVARIGYINVKTGRMTYPCCGSIISDRTVLTAAHCALAKADNYQLASVRVGEYEGKGDPDCTKSFCAHPVQDIAVSHVIVHPGFERKIFKHDVALLILNIPMNFSVAALPICLLENSNVPLVGRRASLVGWGKTPGQTGERRIVDPAGIHSGYLQILGHHPLLETSLYQRQIGTCGLSGHISLKTATPSREQLLELPIVPLDQCNKIYSQVIPVTQNQMCVGGEARKDACSGFGGAPLILLDHYSRSRYYQVGIASFGSNKCGTQGVPSVYSSVHRYAEWIRNNMV